jgi:hypothetical protein
VGYREIDTGDFTPGIVGGMIHTKLQRMLFAQQLWIENLQKIVHVR